MKEMKKWISLVLAVLMMISVFSGCSPFKKAKPDDVVYEKTQEEHIVGNPEKTQYYADNELSIVANEQASYRDIEKLAEKYDAQIVGYIKISGDYLWRLREKKTYDELTDLAKKITNEELVDSCEINYQNRYDKEELKANQAYVEPNDSKWSGEWNESYPAGLNWGVEAIDANKTWLIKESLEPVNVGLIDVEFQEHEDLDYAELFYNTEKTKSEHGNHVAGIMAAGHNNGKGIAGVYPYGESEDDKQTAHLYGASYSGAVSEEGYSGDFFHKAALAKLVERDVKVINYSMGFADSEMVYAATQGNKEAISAIENASRPVEDFLKRLIGKGYDFVIVCAAGNEGGVQFKKVKASSKYPYGYQMVSDGGERGKNMADYGSIFNVMKEETVKNRIIVTGSVKLESGFKNYRISNFSSTGDRVDIMAPGEKIVSCVLNNEYARLSGTSMASPHIAGIAASIWSFNHNMTGEQVKKFITQAADNVTVKGTSVKMANCASILTYVSYATGKAVEKQQNALFSIEVLENGNYTPLSNAKVSVRAVGTEQSTQDVFTDAGGNIQAFIAPGTYQFVIESEGYKQFVSDSFELTSGSVFFHTYILEKALTDFSLPTDMEITIGDVDVIEPEVTPADSKGYSFSWTSSNPEVATVIPTGENGIITAKSAGETQISAEYTNAGVSIKKVCNVRIQATARDTILVLDVSASMDGEPLTEMKEAAKKFCDDLLGGDTNNRVGIVFFNDQIYTESLTDDLTYLKERIDSVEEDGQTNMQAALATADDMLYYNAREGSIRNVVIMADGMANNGQTSDSGSYGSVAKEYEDISKYWNAVVDTANQMKPRYNMYSLGFYHTIEGEVKDYTSRLMEQIADGPENYQEVIDGNNLKFAFGEVTEDISDESSILICIACPVEVTASYGGERLCSAQKYYNDAASFGTLKLLGKNKDIKILSLDDANKYDILLKGTDEGVMDYSVNYIDKGGNIIDYRGFPTIPVSSVSTMNTNTDNSNEIMTLSLDENGDGKEDKVYSSKKGQDAILTLDNTVIPDEIIVSAPATKLNIFPIIIIAAAVLIIGIVILAIILIVKTKSNTKAIANIQQQDRSLVLREDEFIDLANRYAQRVNTQDLSNNDRKGSLVFSTGPLAGASVPLEEGKVIKIGKSVADCALVMPTNYSTISRVHCAVMKKGYHFYISDLSTNGVYRSVPKQRITQKGTWVRVEPNEVINLANTDINFFFMNS